MKLYNGDCLEIMKNFENNSIDSIVTDPPYGLSFMGKKWDYDVPSIEIWKECLRVLKPGGHLLSFGSSRTYHRIAGVIEDAGFEIRDQIMWVYGCLSEDTEILTINGWERYHKSIDKNPILCYNIENNEFIFEKPIRNFFYENKHTAYRIQSDNTDQIVSKNHRVIIEQCGRKVFKRAEELALESEATIPFLENLSELPQTIFNSYEGTSIKKQVLLKVCAESDRPKKFWEETKKTKMSYMSERVLSKWSKQEKTKNILFKTLFRKSKGLVKTLFSKWKGKEKTWNGIEGGKKSRLEGWNNLFSQERKLRKIQNKIRALSQRVFRYGSQRWLCYGTQITGSTEIGEMLKSAGGGSSQRPQSREQYNRKFNVIQKQQRTQNIRSTRAKITPIEYKGNVWCVEVPSGAFVARRNGKIFITGNSGFPKSLNIGKSVNRLETKEWLKISKALDNIDKKSIMKVWKRNLNNVKIVETQSLKNQIIVGQDIQKENFVVLNVIQNINQEKSNLFVSFAEKNLKEAQATNTKINTVLKNVEAEIKQLPDLVKSVGKLSQNQNLKYLNIFTAQCDVKEWLKENTMVNLKVDEALKTLRGNEKYSNEEIINVLFAVLQSVLKLTILNQSKTFQNLDTKLQMECVSVINVTITEYIMEHLILNTVNILKRKVVDKLQENEREPAGRYTDPNGVEYRQTGNRKNFTAGNADKIKNCSDDRFLLTKGTSEWEGWGTALKPSHEDIVLAQKPLITVPFCDIMVSLIKTIGGALCQLPLFVKTAEKSLRSNPRELEGELSIALWLAGENINTQESLSVLMDISQLVSTENANWNIVLLWLNILEEIYEMESKSIISTNNEMTTELKILNSLQWQNIFQNIIQVKDNQVSGLKSDALTAVNIFNALKLKLNYIREHFVQESVILREKLKNLRPNHKPIVLARKPFKGTVAKNVLKWGVGGLNIDGCRVGNEERKNQQKDTTSWHGNNWSGKPQKNNGEVKQVQGRFPANLILSYHESKYMLKENLTQEQKEKVMRWLSENI